jgi:hypothetical protein
MDVLIIRTRHNPATLKSFDWLDDVIINLSKTNFSFEEVSGQRAIRANIEETLKRNKNQKFFIIFYGLGTKDGTGLIGNDNAIALDDLNCGLLSNDIIYTVACKSAIKLGPASVQKGADCYFGYTDKVWCVCNTHPIFKDINNALKESVNSGIYAMLFRSLTSGEAEQEIVFEYKKQYNNIALKGHPIEASFLLTNTDCLKLCGDINAKFSK